MEITPNTDFFSTMLKSILKENAFNNNLMIWLRIPNFGEFHFLKRGLNNLNYCCSNAVDQKTTFLACIKHIFCEK